MFDLLTLPIKPVFLTDAAGKDMSQSYDNWIKTVPDASYYWYRQAVIALSTEAPVRVPREMMRTLTPAHERTLQVQFDRLYRGNVVAFFTFELASEDALAKGATGARFMFFGLWAGNRSDQVLAHEVGHTLDLGNDGNHDGPVPHPPSALMNSGVGGVRLLLRDILAARPKAIEYIRGRP